MASVAASPQARMVIEEAFERLERSVTVDDARQFHSTSLRDVRDAALAVEDRFSDLGTVRNLRRIEPLIEGLKHYSNFVEILCNGTPYLPWIWAPIKLMLQLSSDYLESFDKLMAAYARIAEALPRFDRLNEAFKADVNFQKVLAVFYSDILEFHRRAYKFFRQRAWKRFFNSSWARFDVRFKTILESLVIHTELVDKEANALHIIRAEEQRQQIDELAQKREEEMTSMQLDFVMSWLKFYSIPSHEDELERLIQHCIPGTCDWILNNAKIMKWMEDDPSCNLVWVHGKPGAGKSVICSSLIQSLQQRKRPVLYFFCNYRLLETNKCLHVLSSLAGQILQQNLDLIGYVHDEFVRKLLTPSIKNLRVLLLHLLSTIPSARIVIDGLDESPVEEQQQVLNEIVALVKSGSMSPPCKVLFSSRDIPEISRGISRIILQKATISLSEESGSVNTAIESFIIRKFLDLETDDGFPHLNDSRLSRIKCALTEKADGMFLWVRLVLDSLEEVQSLQELDTVVDLLPSGLTAMYDRILINIKERAEKIDRLAYGKAHRIFEWLLHSKRPLRKAELLDAIAIHSTNVVLQESTKLFERALDTCKPLIEQGPNDTIVLIHFSLKEYLIFSNNAGISELQAHHDIALACISIVSFSLNLLDDTIPQDQHVLTVGKGLLTLLPYAQRFWLDHLLRFAELNKGLSQERSDHLLRWLIYLSTRHECLSQNYTPAPAEQNISPDYSAVVQDTRLRYLDPHPAYYNLISRALSFQKVLEDQLRGCDTSSADHALSRDPTLMSHLMFRFKEIMNVLLIAEAVPGLTSAELSAFKKFHGFHTEKQRNQHEEAIHLRRLPCQEATCTYSTIGFRSQTELKRHMQNYHPEITIKIPRTLRGGRSKTPVPRKSLQPNKPLLGPSPLLQDHPNAQEQMLQQEFMHQQQGGEPSRQIMQIMDRGPLPQRMIDHISIPADIMLWGQLKDFLLRNPNPMLPMERLNEIQRMQYTLAVSQVTPADIQRTRQQHGHRVVHMSDDVLRQHLAHVRLQLQQKAAIGQPNIQGMPQQPPNMGMAQQPNMQQPQRPS